MTTSIPHVAQADRFKLLVDGIQDYGIAMLDPQGCILSWNSGAHHMHGYAAAQAIGQSVEMLYPESLRDIDGIHFSAEQTLEHARRQGKHEEEAWRVRKDGTRFWANVVTTALYDEHGTLVGYGQVTRDLSERRQHLEALRQSEESLRLLIGSVKDYAIYMLTPEGIIHSCNHGAQLIKGYTAREVIGQHYRMFFRAEDIAAGLPERELQKALKHGRVEEEGWRLRKDGSAFWGNIIMTPIESEGRLIGFAKVTRDMSERQRLRDLEHSSKRMNEFLSMLAHELRNPLAPIRNAVSILQLEPSPTPTIKTIRDMIDRQLTHMTRLVDDLLDAGRMTSGKIRIKPELLCFNHVIAIAVEAIRPDFNARAQHFSADLPTRNIWLKGDATRLAQVLQNLLGNASKFTPHGGSISLQAEVIKGQLHVQVRDNGIGMSAENMEHIFELFAQGDGFTSGQSGLGIGLSLARSLIEMHGGSIHVESAGPGQGCTFKFELPGATLRHSADHEEAPEGTCEDTMVLVVDDNKDGADSLADILRSLGHQVQTAYEGQTALQMLQRRMAQTVLLDIRMPDMDGPSVLRAIRAMPGGEQVFICAISGYNLKEDSSDRPLLDGFDAHLQKPVELEALRQILSRSMHG